MACATPLQSRASVVHYNLLCGLCALRERELSGCLSAVRKDRIEDDDEDEDENEGKRIVQRATVDNPGKNDPNNTPDATGVPARQRERSWIAGSVPVLPRSSRVCYCYRRNRTIEQMPAHRYRGKPWTWVGGRSVCKFGRRHVCSER